MVFASVSHSASWRIHCSADVRDSQSHPSPHLRIPDSYDAKIAKICNFQTLWPVIPLINNPFQIRHKTFLHLWSIGQKTFCRILKRLFISQITGHNVQKLQILAIFAP